MCKLKNILLLIVCVSFMFFSLKAFAEQKKPIASWREIIIGKTTEEEIIVENPEGSVSLSVSELVELTKGQKVLRTLVYGSEYSYAEAKRKRDERNAFAYKEGGKELVKAFDMLHNAELELENSLKPILLKSSPIDLRWDKLGCAKLYIYSNGVVQGWVIAYWFFDPSDSESLKKRIEYLPTKDEILEIFETELGKPEKILKPDSQYDVYVYSVDERKLKLKLQYHKDKKVLYIEFFEKNMLSILSEQAIQAIELYKEKPETK